MLKFYNRNEMIIWVIDNYFCGYMWKFSELTNLNDIRLAKEIKRISKNSIQMTKENNVYILEYLF